MQTAIVVVVTQTPVQCQFANFQKLHLRKGKYHATRSKYNFFMLALSTKRDKNEQHENETL